MNEVTKILKQDKTITLNNKQMLKVLVKEFKKVGVVKGLTTKNIYDIYTDTYKHKVIARKSFVSELECYLMFYFLFNLKSYKLEQVQISWNGDRSYFMKRFEVKDIREIPNLVDIEINKIKEKISRGEKAKDVYGNYYDYDIHIPFLEKLKIAISSFQ